MIREILESDQDKVKLNYYKNTKGIFSKFRK
jgi:hypothetical protein